METSPAVLDCRELTPALTVLRIKQAACSTPASDTPLHVILGAEGKREHISTALAELAERIRYVTPDDGDRPDTVRLDEPPVEVAPLWWQRPLRHRAAGHRTPGRRP